MTSATEDTRAGRMAHRHRDYRSLPRHTVAVLVDNVDKAPNLGGILRTAEAFLAEAVAVNVDDPDLGGSMGAHRWQPVAWNVDLASQVASYRARGYAIVALEQAPEAIALSDFEFPEKTALVVGSEMFGVSAEMLTRADAVVYIPMAGLAKSLNVITATAIAVYEYSRQWWMKGFEQPARHLAPASESVRIKGAGTEPEAGRHGSNLG